MTRRRGKYRQESHAPGATRPGTGLAAIGSQFSLESGSRFTPGRVESVIVESVALGALPDPFCIAASTALINCSGASLLITSATPCVLASSLASGGTA